MWKLFAHGGKAPAAGGQGAPASYAQWSQCLDALARGDDDENCLQTLYAGSLHWSAGVAPLFVERLSGEVQRRLNVCADRLQRDLHGSGHESLVVRAIVQARTQLYFVHRLCLLPALPSDTRSQLADEVRKFAERSQHSLEDSARADRSGQLATLLRNNPLTRYVALAQPPDVQSPPTPASMPAQSPRKRNILL